VSLSSKSCPTAVETGRGHDGFNRPSRCSREGTSRRVSTFHAVEFSKTAPSLRAEKSLRLAPKALVLGDT